MTTGYIILLAVVVGIWVLAILAYLLYRRFKKNQGKGRGRDADAGKAASAMRGFAHSNDFRFISPATLSSGGKTASLDAIVVGYFGVLGLISLGYNGNVFGAPDEDEWLQVTKEEQRNYFPNPLDEASAAVRVIRDALSGPKTRRVPVEVACVFTSDKVELALPRSSTHYTMATFKKQLKREKYQEDCGLNLDEVEKAIRAALVNVETV